MPKNRIGLYRKVLSKEHVGNNIASTIKFELPKFSNRTARAPHFIVRRIATTRY